MTVRPASISLCLCANGEAAIMYCSPKGKQTVVARGAWDAMAESDAREFVSAIMSCWTGRRPLADQIAAETFAAMKADSWLPGVTLKGLAKIIEGEEIT